MSYTIKTGQIIAWKYPDLSYPEDYSFNARSLELTWNTVVYPKPTESEVLAQEKPWAAWKKRIDVKKWAAEINSRAYQTKLPDAVDNMLTQDVRQGFREATNVNTNDINIALNTAIASAVTTIETERDDPGNALNANAKKAVDAVLVGINTLSDAIGSVFMSNNESKDHFKIRPRFHAILMGGEARGLMKTEVNALRDDPLATVDDILAYPVDDAKAGTVHAVEYPTETPTLAERLIEYPADYEA